jgi:hypothetical protein
MALWARRRGREDETVQIEARYGPQLIGVSTAPDDGQRSVVDVVEMAALVKVAETYGSVLLDHRQNGTHSYYTDGGTTIYRYQPASRSRGLGKRARPVLDLAEAQASCSSAAPDDPDQTAVEIGTLLGKVETWAASLLEEAAPQGDESRDDAELNATSLPVEPQAQAPLAEVDRAAEELEAALEARRSQAERELADSRETAEERLAAAREHAEQLRLEAERYRAEAKASSGKQLIEARRQAAEVLKEANEQAERIRAEAERELAAARERRENINAQLANVRQMLTVVEATTDGVVSVSEVLT